MQVDHVTGNEGAAGDRRTAGSGGRREHERCARHRELARPAPAAFIATTRNWYTVPFCKPVTVTGAASTMSLLGVHPPDAVPSARGK